MRRQIFLQKAAETFRRAKAQIANQTETVSNSRILNLLERMNSEQPEYLEWLSVKKDERIKLFKTEDVNWIEAQGNYVLLKFAENTELLRETMDSLETQLNPRVFMRIHRSTIINVNYIEELQVWRRGEYRAVMRDGKAFTLSRSYRNRFEELFKKRPI